MVVNLKDKKRLASRVTGVGVHRINFDTDPLDDVADALTRENIRFFEIAGNDEILVTAIAPSRWKYDLKSGKTLFAMKLLTRPKLKRIAILAPVRALHRILAGLIKKRNKIEHIYDY